MKMSAPLTHEAASTHASLIRRKIDAGGAAIAAGDDFDTHGYEEAAKAVVLDFFGAAEGSPSFIRRNVTAQDFVRRNEFACWYAFASDEESYLVAFDPRTALAAAQSGLGKPIENVNEANLNGVDRFLASVFAKRLATAFASLSQGDDDDNRARTCQRTRLGETFADLRVDGLEGAIELFEYSQFTVGDGLPLHFLFARTQSSVHGAARDNIDDGAHAAAVRRMARHSLSAAVRVFARKRMTKMTFSSAASLAPGDILRCDSNDDNVEIIAASHFCWKKIMDAAFGHAEGGRAVQIRRAGSRSANLGDASQHGRKAHAVG